MWDIRSVVTVGQLEKPECEANMSLLSFYFISSCQSVTELWLMLSVSTPKAVTLYKGPYLVPFSFDSGVWMCSKTFLDSLQCPQCIPPRMHHKSEWQECFMQTLDGASETLFYSLLHNSVMKGSVSQYVHNHYRDFINMHRISEM